MSKKGLVDAYLSIYEEKEVETVEVEIISEQDFDNLIEELVEECIQEEIDLDLLEDAVLDYMDEAKVTFGHDTTAKRASGMDVGARRRQAKRKIGDAVDKAKSTAKAKAAGAAITGYLAAKSAKKAAGAAKKAVADAPGKAKAAVTTAASDAKKKAKSGIKGMIGRAAKKVASKASAVASRMSEEVEALKASGKFSEKEIEAFMEAEVSEGLKPYPAEKVARKREAVKKKEDIHIARGEYDKADKQYKRGVSLAMKSKMKK